MLNLAHSALGRSYSLPENYKINSHLGSSNSSAWGSLEQQHGSY